MNHLLIEAEQFVVQLFEKELGTQFLYHSLEHTRNVVAAAKEIADASEVEEKEKELLLLASWFHDTGYTKNVENHEEESVLIAESFFKSKEVSKDDIHTVSKLILATRMEARPVTPLEKIIRDADCAHFGSKDYELISDLLRAEWELTLNKQYTDLEWVEENIQFYNNFHQFHTAYAKKEWSKRKLKNLGKLVKSAQELRKEAQKSQASKKKVGLPERGVETMFRVTLRNHITLSDIADTKANIMLSVNAIIVSLVLANLIPKLDNPSNGYLIYPTLIFVLFTIASMILSVIATRPNVTSGEFTREDVAKKKINLLFFGNFHKMPLEDFEWGMNEMMQDKDYLYNSMIKDLYFLGKVLHRKYSILRWTYAIFIIGIVVSLIAFTVAFQTV